MDPEVPEPNTRIGEMQEKLTSIKKDLERRLGEYNKFKIWTIFLAVLPILTGVLIFYSYRSNLNVVGTIIAALIAFSGGIMWYVFKYCIEQIDSTRRKINAVVSATNDLIKYKSPNIIKDECFEKVEKFLL